MIYLICLLALHANAADKVLGLVEIPALFGTHQPHGPPGQVAPKSPPNVELRAAARADAKVIYRVTNTEQITAREHGYEESSAVVYGRDHGWYLVQTSGGRGWLDPRAAGAFRAYGDLLKNAMVYLSSETWDGRLYAAPGGAFETKTKTENVDVRILGSKTIGSDLWYQVQLAEGRCEGDARYGAKGWVRAYDANGNGVLWFYARGC